MRSQYCQCCNMIEAPWLANGGRGASFRYHMNKYCDRDSQSQMRSQFFNGGRQRVRHLQNQLMEVTRPGQEGRTAVNVGECQAMVLVVSLISGAGNGLTAKMASTPRESFSPSLSRSAPCPASAACAGAGAAAAAY
jgi:hypothetical protein